MSRGAGEQGSRGEQAGDSSAPPLLHSSAPLLPILRLAARAPLPAGYWVAGLAGELYYWLNPGHSRHAVANMAVVLAQRPSAPAVRRIARQSFRYYGMALLDVLRLATLRPADYERGVLGYGWEHLDAALARGRGAIVATFHFGAWDRAVAIVGGRGYRPHTLVDTVGPPALDAVVQGLRARYGLTLIPVERAGALRQVYSALRDNQLVALLADRPQREQGTPVTFFGRQTWLPSGPAALALRTGAPLLFGYLLRRPDLLSYQGGFEPVEAPRTGNRPADEAALMQALVDRMERLIQQHPEQWYMFRPMWPEETGDGFTAEAQRAQRRIDKVKPDHR